MGTILGLKVSTWRQIEAVFISTDAVINRRDSSFCIEVKVFNPVLTEFLQILSKWE